MSIGLFGVELPAPLELGVLLVLGTILLVWLRGLERVISCLTFICGSIFGFRNLEISAFEAELLVI